jgi:hypothetical protein
MVQTWCLTVRSVPFPTVFDLSHTLLDVGMVALVGVGILFSIRLHSRLVFIRLSCLSLCLLGGFCKAAGIVSRYPVASELMR